MGNFGAFVLSIDSEFENSPLFTFLSSLPFKSLTTVPGVRPTDLGCKKECQGHGWNNELSCIEFAVAEGHRKMRNLARSHDLDSILFLEDDAIPNCTPREVIDLLKWSHQSTNHFHTCAVHLFPEQGGLLVEKYDGCCKCAIVPDYAVAYILNSKSLDRLEQLDSIKSESVADWPREIRKLRWYCPKKSFFIHPDIQAAENRSFTKVSRAQRHAKKSTYIKLINPHSYTFILLIISSVFFGRYGRSKIESERLRSVKVGKLLRRAK